MSGGYEEHGELVSPGEAVSAMVQAKYTERAACIRRVREACPLCKGKPLLDCDGEQHSCIICTPFVLAIEKGD